MTATPRSTVQRLGRLDPWMILAGVIASLVLGPLLVIVYLAAFPTENIWPHLASTVLPRYAMNTIVLMVSVGAGALVLGTGLAYVVTHFEFPGRRWLQYALLAPLAVPGYVGAYALVDFLEYAGPVQTGLRDLFGWANSREYWFPEIRSRGSAIVVLSLTLYPYVYLLARASFKALPSSGQDVARSLGVSPFAQFWRVSLPLARPGIVAGTAVVMMETVNDFGTVEFFAVQTLTTGIFSVWLESSNVGGAAQLALCALAVIAILATIEKIGRQKLNFAKSGRQVQTLQPRPVQHGWRLTVLCLVPLVLGFLAPVLILINLLEPMSEWRRGIFSAIQNSVVLGVLAGVIAVSLAMILVHGFRGMASSSQRGGLLMRFTALGYAIPGAVLGLGVLIPLATVDRAMATVWMDWTGDRLGLLITGSGAALVLAYVVRFFAIAIGSAEAGYAAIAPSVPMAARSLGLGPGSLLWRVFRPLLRGTVASALVLVFVDSVKELPATLLLRPFNFNTLATYTYDQASLEDLAGAAPGALMIVAVSFAAVILLARFNR